MSATTDSTPRGATRDRGREPIDTTDEDYAALLNLDIDPARRVVPQDRPARAGAPPTRGFLSWVDNWTDRWAARLMEPVDDHRTSPSQRAAPRRTPARRVVRAVVGWFDHWADEWTACLFGCRGGSAPDAAEPATPGERVAPPSP